MDVHFWNVNLDKGILRIGQIYDLQYIMYNNGVADPLSSSKYCGEGHC